MRIDQEVSLDFESGEIKVLFGSFSRKAFVVFSSSNRSVRWVKLFSLSRILEDVSSFS